MQNLEAMVVLIYMGRGGDGGQLNSMEAFQIKIAIKFSCLIQCLKKIRKKKMCMGFTQGSISKKLQQSKVLFQS